MHEKGDLFFTDHPINIREDNIYFINGKVPNQSANGGGNDALIEFEKQKALLEEHMGCPDYL